MHKDLAACEASLCAGSLENGKSIDNNTVIGYKRYETAGFVVSPWER